MRSLRYVAGGNPHNTDDCIDYAAKVKDAGQANVLVSLHHEEDATELWVINRLYGRFMWTFPDGKTVRYHKGFGGCFSHEKGLRQMLSIDNANYRLNEIVKRIIGRGNTVNGSIDGKTIEQLPQFDYSEKWTYIPASALPELLKEKKELEEEENREVEKAGEGDKQ
jgi:hypothetical protein